MEENIDLNREKRLMRYNKITELMLNENLTAEEIYQKIMEMDPKIMRTKRIMRSEKNWKNCIYEGAIGEDDFVVAEASSSSLAYMQDIVAKHDDMKDTLVKFIENFRIFLKNNRNNNLLSSLIKYMPEFLILDFDGASRDGGNAAIKRGELAKRNKESQFSEYNISNCKGSGNNAVCVERNSTLGNIFEFCGFETFQISGEMSHRNNEVIEAHHFLLIKHGPNSGQYSLIDLFNDIVIENVAEGNYDLSNGFEISKFGKTYRLKGPLIEMTPKMLAMERDFKALNGGFSFIDSQLSKYKKSNFCDLKLEHFEKLIKGYKDLIEKINNSDVDIGFKNRLLSLANQYIAMLERKKEKYEIEINNESTIER